MSLIPTNLYINWSNFTFTPAGGVAIAVARVTSCKQDRSAVEEKFKGDNALFWQAVATPTQERSIEVDFGDIVTAQSIPVGVVGAMGITLADAQNGILPGGGGVHYTLTPCVCTGVVAGGDHAKFGGTTVKFTGFNPDGVTDPLTKTAL
jgi:hypothetical protein